MMVFEQKQGRMRFLIKSLKTFLNSFIKKNIIIKKHSANSLRLDLPRFE